MNCKCSNKGSKVQSKQKSKSGGQVTGSKYEHQINFNSIILVFQSSLPSFQERWLVRPPQAAEPLPSLIPTAPTTPPGEKETPEEVQPTAPPISPSREVHARGLNSECVVCMEEQVSLYPRRSISFPFPHFSFTSIIIPSLI